MTTADELGHILRVDLTDETVESEPIPDGWRRRYLGGKGLGARYLYEEVEPGIDPLGPANVLCLFRGPLSGHLPGETRYAAITKSPLTGLFVDSYSGGGFATSLVGALGDHMGVIIEGAADDPVELSISDGDATIRSAADRWGLRIDALDEAIDEGDVAGIGPAGEQLVRFATIGTDGGAHHAGRGGTGAVMGAKRLKAVIADGEPVDRPALTDALQAYVDRFEGDPRGRAHRASGTVETADAADTLGVLPTKGWSTGTFEHADDIGIQAVRMAATDRERAGDLPGDFDLDGLVARGGLGIALGANLGIDDFDAVADLGRACDTLGVDIIEAGSAIAWAILASDRGLIDRQIDFGDADAARQLLDEIATRSTPLGDRLSAGIDRAAEAGGENLVPTVKSMTAGSYDPRGAPAMALAFATSDRGACHRRARPVFDEMTAAEAWDDEARVAAVIEEQNRQSALWCLIVDDAVAFAFADDLGEPLLEAIGWSVEPPGMAAVGERVWTLTRLFNLREGATDADDRLPPVFSTPLDGGPASGEAIDPDGFEALRDRYYEERGWTDRGQPSQELVERLGLAAVLSDSNSTT